VKSPLSRVCRSVRKHLQRAGGIWLVQAAGLCAIAADTALAAPPEATAAEGIEFFEAHIRPVLVEHCYECHSAEATIVQGGLRLDTAERVRAGGDSGPVVVPHQADESLLLTALRYESYEMPPSGKLPDEVIENFAKWISLGAPDPRKDAVAADAAAKIGNDSKTTHWAFQRPERVAPPAVRREAAVRSDLDRFVLAKLEAAGLAPSPQAPPRALLRRLYYDLIGLPPSATELAEFAADPSDERYEATVERLLASPRFGERWARHWLDVARYADTKGYVFEEDRNYKHAYLYRDWVIASFNSDRPFQEFIIAQLAADQLDESTETPAMGFLTLGRRFLNSPHEIINDRIDVITRGMLGLTVACARCHDHKHDPISAADYYAMYGVLASSEEKPREDGPPMLVDAEKPVEPVIFLRGNPGSPGPKVPRRFLTCLTADHDPQPFQHGSGRREMAEAIAHRDNPLTARVWVNRVWGHLFGRGIVATPSDFGTHGMPPSHPQLLDWLACELMDDAWSTKRIVRSMVLSSTYRQSSDARADGDAADPENIMVWRANRRRLDLESFRDSLLVAAGRLDETAGGPSVSLTDAPFSARRSVYGFIERQNLPAFFRTFDFANPNTHTPERPQTTAPQQALFLMNSPFVLEQAAQLAARSTESNESAGSPASKKAAERVRRINRLYLAALGREPNIEELTDALEFVDVGEPPAAVAIASQTAWQFGWGAFDEPTGSLQFQALGHFTGASWQGAAVLPDATLGWAMLNAEGGHPGDAAHQVIRRWVAPVAGTLQIEGVLSHPANQGDGVRGRIVASRGGLVGAWEVRQSEAATAPPAIQVQPGDTVDFVTDCRNSIEFDSFTWSVTLRLAALENDPGQIWDSVGGFHGPIVPPLTRWQQLAQVLLMSNEFMFVD
jgi:Protein of unknown function (DUF1553)/Protein of unknown function (DUF1549)/Planctomycete cytochrome C